jgi:methionyl-tRNA formyltransferase
MKVVILTSSVFGTAGHHLPKLFASKGLEIVMVVVSEGKISNKKKNFLKRLNKIRRIGILGALNGIRMRKWYTEDMSKYCSIVNSEAFCKEHHIAFRRVPYTNSDATQQLFTEAGADVGLSLGNDYISAKIFSIPRYGMLNIHHELLPNYQNAQSIIWELYNGSSETGYTIHKIDRHIDTGDILVQEKAPIVFRNTLADTVAYNYAMLFEHSAKGLTCILENFEKHFTKAKPQGQGQSYTTPSFRQFLKIYSQFRTLKKMS